MNTLSWLIYGAGVCEGLGVLVVILALMSGLATVGMAIPVIVFACEGEEAAPFDKWLKRLAPIFVAMMLIGALIPSRNTVLMIAVSELGERAVAGNPAISEISDKALKVLNKYLDDALADRRGK